MIWAASRDLTLKIPGECATTSAPYSSLRSFLYRQTIPLLTGWTDVAFITPNADGLRQYIGAHGIAVPQAGPKWR